MTGQQKKPEYAPAGKIVHATRGIALDDVDAALIEQIYEIQGAAAVAALLAWRLRQQSPDPATLHMVARWLDPQSNDWLRLEIVRRRDGRSPTKRVNDIALKKAVAEHQRARGNKHGSQNKAVGEVAKQFGVSKAMVLKAIRRSK